MSDNQLRSIIERVRNRQDAKREIEDDIKEIYAEARSNGFDVKVLRAVVKHLGKDEGEVAEFDALFDTYLRSYRNSLAGAPRATRTHEEAA